MTVSKQQEREALKKIRTIIENLGEDSYLATAFEGCFEIAESNIDNDFANSLKESCTTLKQNLASAHSEVEKLKKELETANNSIKQLKEKKPQLTCDDIADIRYLLYDRINEYLEMQRKTAQQIVELAETPESEKFKQMVRDNRTAKKQTEYYEMIVKRLG